MRFGLADLRVMCVPGLRPANTSAVGVDGMAFELLDCVHGVPNMLLAERVISYSLLQCLAAFGLVGGGVML